MTKKEYDAKRYLEKKSSILQQSKSYYEKNKERVLKRHARWRSENKEVAAKCERDWRLANPGRSRAKVRGYQAKKLKATPKWANKKAIANFYTSCPEGYEVDHILPVQGKTVCGLHVLENLQYLPKAINRSKSNKC